MTQKPIELHPYAPMYQQYFLKECGLLEKLLRSNCINVYHIGSTAIPAIVSRPTLDILCVAHTLDGIMHFEEEFTRGGLSLQKKLNDDKRMVFERISQDGELTLSRIYIHDKSDPRIEDYLKLKDHFKKDKDAAKRFEANKLEFAQNPQSYEKQKAGLFKLILESLS